MGPRRGHAHRDDAKVNGRDVAEQWLDDLRDARPPVLESLGDVDLAFVRKHRGRRLQRGRWVGHQRERAAEVDGVKLGSAREEHRKLLVVDRLAVQQHRTLQARLPHHLRGLLHVRLLVVDAHHGQLLLEHVVRVARKSRPSPDADVEEPRLIPAGWMRRDYGG